jgi:hypothetical protein
MFATKASALFRFISLAAYLLSNVALAASWTTSVDQRQGLPVVSRGGASAPSSALCLLGKDWAWAGQQIEFKVVAPFLNTPSPGETRRSISISAVA